MIHLEVTDMLGQIWYSHVHFFSSFSSELKGLISVFLVSYLTITLTKLLIVHQKSKKSPKGKGNKKNHCTSSPIVALWQVCSFC